jgi:hypothetical protein
MPEDTVASLHFDASDRRLTELKTSMGEMGALSVELASDKFGVDDSLYPILV